MAITEIKDGDLVLARHVSEEDAWTKGLSFFSLDDEYEQVGTWGYDQGQQLQAHTHNEVSRIVLRTQEVLYIRKGMIQATIYNIKEQKIAELNVSAGDILILLRGGHGYKILEDDTQVLEIKNGPYVGAEADRRRL